MNELDKKGGYPVPDRIAIWLLRAVLLQLLADRAELGKGYYFDNEGLRVYGETENG